MSIYDINYTNAGNQLLPPDKRGGYMRSWISVLMKPLQYLRDLVLGDYRVGSPAPPFVISTTYATGDRVQFKGTVYESLVAGNLGNEPPNDAYWVVVQANFIGVYERVLYNGNVLMLTFALNKFFGTTFRQPNNVSDIYIEAVAKPQDVFIVGWSEDESSTVFANSSTEVIIDAYAFASYSNMIIWVPVAVFNALDTIVANREKIVRNFADRYVVAGITYTVQTY
jgi:hypothetical protein